MTLSEASVYLHHAMNWPSFFCIDTHFLPCLFCIEINCLRTGGIEVHSFRACRHTVIPLKNTGFNGYIYVYFVLQFVLFQWAWLGFASLQSSIAHTAISPALFHLFSIQVLACSSRRLKLTFRPEMVFSKPACGDCTEVNGLLLRVRGYRNTRTGQVKIVPEVMGRVPRLYKFEGIRCILVNMGERLCCFAPLLTCRFWFFLRLFDALRNWSRESLIVFKHGTQYWWGTAVLLGHAYITMFEEVCCESSGWNWLKT